jgi:catechol 2,3-dioxygenase-like lactoylglutathione lyase family enzyme
MVEALTGLQGLPQEAAAGHPVLNHVALSVPADLLAADGRADLVRFYRDVFGWQEIEMMTEDRNRLVLMLYEYGQFLYVIADDRPMAAPRMDHFGISVGSEDQLDTFLARAKAFAADDSRVDVIDKTVEDYGIGKIHSFYVGYLLPMMVEVQWFERVA